MGDCMAANWKDLFDNFGVKTVSPNDKTKKAYVPTKDQRVAIAAAGILPATTRPGPTFDVTVLFDPHVATVESSYYGAARSVAANRTPEPRMGHGIISSWLKAGDEVLIGNIGAQLFALKLASAPPTDDEAIAEVGKKASKSTVLGKAKKATGKPPRRSVTRSDFVRNPWVVAGAIARANGKCEVPGCACALFLKDDDTPYLEVHHIVPLAEGGDDTLINAAAICPHCHRVLHHGKDRMTLRSQLASHVAAIPV